MSSITLPNTIILYINLRCFYKVSDDLMAKTTNITYSQISFNTRKTGLEGTYHLVYDQVREIYRSQSEYFKTL